MSLGSATDDDGRDMQTLFGILEAEIGKHVFQPGRIPLVDGKVASFRKQLERKIRDCSGICLFVFAKRGKNVTFVLCLSASSETWCLTANDEKNLHIWGRKLLRKIFGPIYRVSQEECARLRKNVP